MFWWFERNGKHARVEVLEVTVGRFELRTIDGTGDEQVEIFENARSLERRQTQIQQSLWNAGWSGPHGWVM